MGTGPAPAHRSVAQTRAGALVVDADDGVLRQHRSPNRTVELLLGRHEAPGAPGCAIVRLPTHHGGLGAFLALWPAAAPGTGTAFIALMPSRHRYYLPEDSPGWTFGWISLY